jgi:citrate/tricarballylate utilization protein
MPSRDLVLETARLATICGACRYCEAYCAVFPAIERRREFSEGDTIYLANLCHECRTCYYACPYAPPHEFALNLPETLARMRYETYRDFAWPGVLRRVFEKSGRAAAILALAVAGLLFGAGVALEGWSAWLVPRTGPGAFYAVLPYAAIVAVASAMLLYAMSALVVGFVRFWQETGATPGDLLDLRAVVRATADAFGLTYLRGGGPGCTYPDERPRSSRRALHHLVFYGFALDLAATTVAAFYHHALGLEAPYPVLSVPVVLGTIGGVMLLVGTAGLLYLKARSDRVPASTPMQALDVTFLVLLFATSLSGLLLLALRETALMGALLVIHLGLVAGLFLTLPYGKFAHVAYRYGALVRSAIESRRAG